MRNAECQWKRRSASDLPIQFRIPHSEFRIHPFKLSSTSSQIRCSIARCSSWIRAVSSAGTTSAMSASVFSWPPDLPRNATTVTLRACAACAARITLGLSPLVRSEEHTSELQSLAYLVCRLLLEKKNHATLFKTLAYVPDPHLRNKSSKFRTCSPFSAGIYRQTPIRTVLLPGGHGEHWLRSESPL